MDQVQDKIDRLVYHIAGEDAVKIAKAVIAGKENVSEFVLAEQLNIPINLIRNILYKLQNKNLVSSNRKKDKRRGWYIYYWTFDLNEAKSLIKVVKNERINELEKRLKVESETEYFLCPRECLRLNFNNALEQGFKCPECGSPLQRADNSKKIAEIKREIDYLQESKEAAMLEA